MDAYAVLMKVLNCCFIILGFATHVLALQVVVSGDGARGGSDGSGSQLVVVVLVKVISLNFLNLLKNMRKL